MLYVVFTDIDDDSINTFEKISLSEANRITESLEKEYRQNNKKTVGEFYVIDLEDDKNKVLYKGAFKFGYYESPNIYQHIKKILPLIKMSREKEKDKIEFLEKLELETEDKYKVEEKDDVYLQGVSKDQISKLNKTQRKSIYALAMVSTVALMLTIILFNVKNASVVKVLEDTQYKLHQQEEISSIYEKGLVGKDEVVVDYLNNKEDITDEQKLILANYLIKDEKFKEVVDIFDNNVSFVADLVSTTKHSNLQETINLLKKFDAMYPTNQAKYDLEYWNHNYEYMLKIPEVKMNARRSRMKTYAHLKLGQIEEAKVELANNNNEKLKTQINNYELIEAEIELINEKIEAANRNYQSTSKLKEDLEKKKKELDEI